MLKELSIKNFALISNLTVPFTAGFNVLTGEAGAGKSILIDALDTLLAGKVNSTSIRTGAERSAVEASFDPSPEVHAWLKINELTDPERRDLIVSRELTKTGSRSRINGTLVKSSLVKELRKLLITLNAQHESRTLLSSSTQLKLIDGLADTKHLKLLAQVRTLYASFSDLKSELAEITVSEDERIRRLEFAQYQLNELVEANLTDGAEDSKLEAQRNVLAGATDIKQSLNKALVALGGDDSSETPSARDMLQAGLAEISRASSHDPELAAVEEPVAGCLDGVEESIRSLRRYIDRVDTDPETLSQIEERLAELAPLKRKYGPTLMNAISRREELRSEVEKLEQAQIRIESLAKDIEAVSAKLDSAAGKLSASRRELCESIGRRIEEEIRTLGMTNCRFEAMLDESELTSSGKDRIEFLIQPNPGQKMMPVAKIASGGELSRVMLAIKSICAEADGVKTVIFDEIDAGLSGAALKAMRDRLARLSGTHQILCITHQPVIASIADNHVNVSKSQSRQSTSVDVRLLEGDDRVQSLASMAGGGQKNAEEALKFARTLIDEAESLRTRAKSK